MTNNEKCVSCGKFMSLVEEGGSWAQNWHYEMDGSPTLDDPVFQCKTCTDAHGVLASNCNNPECYSGIIGAVEEIGG